MSKAVKFRIRDGIAIVTLSHGASNALDRQVCDGLWDVFGRIQTHSDVRAVALIAEGTMFSAGSDIATLHDPQSHPTLRDVCARIENCPFPVVAGLHGAAYGGGAELALAAHYRIGAANASVSLPELTLGLVSSAGATQRLPRLVGAEAALDLFLSARPISADKAKEIGLLDLVSSDHLHTSTVQFATALLNSDTSPQRTCDRRDGLQNGEAFLRSIVQKRNVIKESKLFAPHKVIDCVEACLILPFDVGSEFERDAFEECLAQPQAHALWHIYIAEREISDRFLTLKQGRRSIVDPEGMQIVERLQNVFSDASKALIENGYTQNDMDAALLDYGFTKTPFGGNGAGSTAPLGDIQRQCVAALSAQGARIMAEGKGVSASVIDALSVHGFGFPRRQGGPMKAAQIMGLLGLQRDMAHWSSQSSIWEVPPLMIEAVKYADGFAAIQSPS